MMNIVYVGSGENENEEELDDLIDQAWGLARESEISILSDKELTAIAVENDEAVGAIFSSFDNGTYSFDVIVGMQHRGKSIGKKLFKYGVDMFHDEYGDIDDARIELDVVNGIAESILSSMGFIVVRRVQGHAIMVPKNQDGIEESKTESWIVIDAAGVAFMAPISDVDSHRDLSCDVRAMMETTSNATQARKLLELTSIFSGHTFCDNTWKDVSESISSGSFRTFTWSPSTMIIESDSGDSFYDEEALARICKLFGIKDDEAITRVRDKIKIKSISENIITEASEFETVDGIEYHTEITDSHRGEIYGYVLAKSKDITVGRLDFSIFEDVPKIHMVEVLKGFQRRGIATKLIEKLKKSSDSTKVDWGGMTPSGVKLRNRIDPGWKKRGEDAAKSKYHPFTEKDYDRIYKVFGKLKKDDHRRNALIDLMNAMGDWDREIWDDGEPSRKKPIIPDDLTM